MRRGTGIKTISTVYYFLHFLKWLPFILYWNTMILTWNETFYSFQRIFLYFEILELRNFKSWHINRKVLILLWLWRCKFLLEKNVYPPKLLGFVSWVVVCLLFYGFGFVFNRKSTNYTHCDTLKIQSSY